MKATIGDIRALIRSVIAEGIFPGSSKEAQARLDKMRAAHPGNEEISNFTAMLGFAWTEHDKVLKSLADASGFSKPAGEVAGTGDKYGDKEMWHVERDDNPLWLSQELLKLVTRCLNRLKEINVVKQDSTGWDELSEADKHVTMATKQWKELYDDEGTLRAAANGNDDSIYHLINRLEYRVCSVLHDAIEDMTWAVIKAGKRS